MHKLQFNQWCKIATVYAIFYVDVRWLHSYCVLLVWLVYEKQSKFNFISSWRWSFSIHQPCCHFLIELNNILPKTVAACHSPVHKLLFPTKKVWIPIQWSNIHMLPCESLHIIVIIITRKIALYEKLRIVNYFCWNLL